MKFHAQVYEVEVGSPFVALHRSEAKGLHEHAFVAIIRVCHAPADDPPVDADVLAERLREVTAALDGRDLEDVVGCGTAEALADHLARAMGPCQVRVEVDGGPSRGGWAVQR